MKFQNCVLINFERTHGQAESNMPLQIFQSWVHKSISFLVVGEPAISKRSNLFAQLQRQVRKM